MTDTTGDTIMVEPGLQRRPCHFVQHVVPALRIGIAGARRYQRQRVHGGETPPHQPKQSREGWNHAPPHHFRNQSTVPCRVHARLYTPVTGKGFIPAIAAQTDLDVLSRQLGNHVGGNSGGIAEGLAVMPDKMREHFQDINGADDGFVVLQTKMARYLAGELQLAPCLFLEPHRKGMHLWMMAGSQSRHQ